MNQERIFTVLREPHITEKVSVQGEEANQYAFKVAPDATKIAADLYPTLYNGSDLRLNLRSTFSS